ncbi:MAG: hypothetical protein K0Q72_4390, partial [Armatimonadetes bacterium]|nr:hypothetical protein [Armatimonadota bacterium]
MAIAFYDRASELLRKLTGRERVQAAPARSKVAGPGERISGAHLELGWGGTPVFGGVVLDDYNPDLQGNEAIRKADQMRRTLGQVRAVTKAITLPITSTPWYLEAPHGAGSAEREATELLRENLFGGMSHSWDALIREACQAIYFGFRAPEIVWEERAGLIAIRKVASRNPELIERWIYHPNGELAGYLYGGSRPVGGGLEQWGSSSSTSEQVPIPIEKVLHFAYDQENENPQGLGLWRSQYPHWYFVFALYKIMGIGAERNLLGVPVAEEGDEAQPDDRAYVLQQLQWMRAAEGSAFSLPRGWKLGWFESGRTPMDALPLVEHHLRQIALAGLAQFLNLGMSAGGTQSLGTVQAKLFEQSEDGAAKWIRETIEDQLIRRWCLLNYGPALRAPRLLHKPIRAHDLQGWANALNALGSGGWLHATPDDEAKLREELELPEAPREQRERTLRAAECWSVGVEECWGEKSDNGAPLFKGKETTAVDGGRRCFDAATEVDRAREERTAQEGGFTSRATALLEGMQERYLGTLRPLVEAALSTGAAPPDLAAVPVPGGAEYQEFVRDYLREVFELGRRALAEETGQAAGGEIPDREHWWLESRA